jgi:hypothetical protein
LLPTVGRSASLRFVPRERVRWALLAIGITTLIAIVEVANFSAVLHGSSRIDPVGELPQGLS